MKKFIIIFIACLILGILCYLILSGVFKIENKRAFEISVSGFIGGLGGMYLKDFFDKRKNKGITK